MTTDNITLKPGQPWKFDADVANVFPDMLARSIPGYARMRELVLDIVSRTPTLDSSDDDVMVVDYGCSTGDGVFPIMKQYPKAYYTLLDSSIDMIGAVRKHLAESFNRGPLLSSIFTQQADFSSFDWHGTRYLLGMDSDEFIDLNLCILTAQFVAHEHRQRFVARMYEETKPGGVLIFVEKILGDTASSNELMRQMYISHKLKNGYTIEQIEAKAEALRGVLVPMTAAGNENLLRRAGWGHIECFWRDINFAGWVAEKPL